MPILSNLIVRIGASTDDFDRQVDKSLNKVKRFGADVSAAGQAISIGFSLPLIAAGGAAIKAASDMESLTMGLKVVMKTSEATSEEMKKLREVAKLPGLGLEEAVKGTIRLQILGNSADESRRIMGELGNALAVVGGGKEDFSEVVRQLSQLGAVGKVTKENLDPIIERIPQIAAIIKEKFGAEALGDPAKTFEKMGISSQQFIRIITDELAKGERAGNTYKNSWKNIQIAAKDAAAAFGEILLPVAQKVLDEFLTPGIEKAKALAAEFKNLPSSTQNWAIALTAVATAAPIVIVALGTLVEKGALLFSVIGKLSGPLKLMAGSLSLVGTAAVGAGAGVGVFLKWLIDHGGKPVDTTAEAIKNLNDKLNKGKLAAGEIKAPFALAMEGIMDFALGLGAVSKVQDEVAEKTVEMTKRMPALARVTLDSAIAIRAMAHAQKEDSENKDRAAEIARRYGTVSYEAAIKATKAWALYFDLTRELAEPTNFPAWTGLGGDFKDIPKYNGTFDAGDFEAYKRGGANVGPEGMMTKEQEQAIKDRYKQVGKTASAAMKQVSTVITDLSRGITDVIFKGGKMADMFKSVAQQAAQSITRLLIEGALEKLSKKLLGIGDLFGKIFGGGKGAASGSGGGDLGAAASAGRSSAGGVSSAAGGVMGIANLITGAVTAVSSVISNFQQAHMNTALGRIEESTRYAKIYLGEQGQSILWSTQTTAERMGYANTALDNIGRFASEMLGNLQQINQKGGMGGGGSVVNINVYGGDTKTVMEQLTRLLKQQGVNPVYA